MATSFINLNNANIHFGSIVIAGGLHELQGNRYNPLSTFVPGTNRENQQIGHPDNSTPFYIDLINTSTSHRTLLNYYNNVVLTGNQVANSFTVIDSVSNITLVSANESFMENFDSLGLAFADPVYRRWTFTVINPIFNV